MSLSLSSFTEEEAILTPPPPYSPPEVEQPVVNNKSNNNNVEEGTAPQNELNFTFANYLRHPARFIGRQSIFNSFKGFLDTLSSQKKLPWRFGINLLYKLGLLKFYFVTFLYQIIAFGVQGEHIAYYITYILISLTGLIHGLYEVISGLYVNIKHWNERRMQLREIAPEDRPNQEAWTTTTTVEPLDLTYYQKALKVLKEYVLHSVGEFLLLPSVILSLYGFVNEKSWKFGDGIAGFNFIMFLYTMGMDAFYGKFYIIWLMQKIIRISYSKYDDLRDESEDKRSKAWRYFSPIYLTIPFAILIAIVHWFILGIIAVRITADNFSIEKDSSDTEPLTGSYNISPFTLYMIICSVYLPIASWIVYILLNKYWFLQIYSLINQFSSTEAIFIWTMPLSVKLFAFLRDPVAYIAVVFLMGPFIAFTAGTFLPDYDSPDYEVASGTRGAAESLGICFIVFFLLANLQATIIFTILVIIIIVLLTILLLFILSCITATERARRDTFGC